MPVYELRKDRLIFPHPSLAEPDGLLAIGGDLSPERLLLAYQNGIFPWYGADDPIMWWSLDPRLMLFPAEFKASKSLRRTIRKKLFSVSHNRAFSQVIRRCARVPRADQGGTWITDEMVVAYEQLFKMGHAHSFETWYDGRLVGGLYGVSIGKAFFGESMFHTKTDASKVAFYHFVEYLQEHDYHFVDAQMRTEHLVSLGAREISRSEYLQLLAKAIAE